jgi:hypothetical protein
MFTYIVSFQGRVGVGHFELGLGQVVRRARGTVPAAQTLLWFASFFFQVAKPIRANTKLPWNPAEKSTVTSHPPPNWRLSGTYVHNEVY